MMTSPVLNHDVFLLILKTLDNATLAQCSLVDSLLNRIAASVLYRTVVFTPEPTWGVIDLRANVFFKPSQFTSSVVLRNADHVLAFEISGYLSVHPRHLASLQARLQQAISAYRNLTKLNITPQVCHPDLLAPVLQAVGAGAAALAELTVGAFCADESKAAVLVALDQVARLTIVDPTRAILTVLPAWLERLSATLVGLHLKGNCGSITPGVLRSFLPHVRNLRSFSLGLSYSLTDADVFAFLAQLTRLEALELQYYVQLSTPRNPPELPALRSFTAHHPPLTTRAEAQHFASWTRRHIRSGPLETLHLVGDAEASLDALVNSLAAAGRGTLKRRRYPRETLRVLDLGASFVGWKALAEVCRVCGGLEVLSVGVGQRHLSDLEASVRSLPKLHTLAVFVSNAQRGVTVFGAEDAERMMRASPQTCLRRIQVDKLRWEGRWISEVREGGVSVRFVVQGFYMHTGQGIELFKTA